MLRMDLILYVDDAHKIIIILMMDLILMWMMYLIL